MRDAQGYENWFSFRIGSHGQRLLLTVDFRFPDDPDHPKRDSGPRAVIMASIYPYRNIKGGALGQLVTEARKDT